MKPPPKTHVRANKPIHKYIIETPYKLRASTFTTQIFKRYSFLLLYIQTPVLDKKIPAKLLFMAKAFVTIIYNIIMHKNYGNTKLGLTKKKQKKLTKGLFFLEVLGF
jgi:hypothetical protein